MPPAKPSIETLSGFNEFTRVITHGRRYEKKPIRAYVILSQSANPTIRVGYAVTRGIRKAVQRNRLKRLMREAFLANREGLVQRLESKTVLEIVFMYSNSPVKKTALIQFSSIHDALAGLCSTIELIQNE